MRGITFSGESIGLGKPLKIILSYPNPKHLSQNATSVIDRQRGVGRVCDRRSDHTLGISANFIFADLTAVYPEPTYAMGRAQQQRLESLNALCCGFAIALVMLNAITTMIGLMPLIRKRAIQMRFPTRPDAMFGCGILFVTAIRTSLLLAPSTICPRPIAWRASSDVRTASRIQMQGGHS